MKFVPCGIYYTHFYQEPKGHLLSILPTTNLFTHLHIHPSIPPSLPSSIHLNNLPRSFPPSISFLSSFHPSIHPSEYPPKHSSFCLSIPPPIRLSVHPFTHLLGHLPPHPIMNTRIKHFLPSRHCARHCCDLTLSDIWIPPSRNLLSRGGNKQANT